ncbi:MAG TPA: UvrD-helicase domain-containing protein, partial [Terriglobales bacterium]|nr:UvrD-helicase domain-containing protein [Terriglobales bacterium]
MNFSGSIFPLTMPLEFDGPQQKAIAHVHGPMLVLAGAGTGKTTVLVERITRLLREKHATAGEIRAVTYTDNSAADIRRKVQERLPGVDCSKLRASTFHAYCFNLLHANGNGFGVVDNADLWIFLRRNLSELRLERFIKAANPGEFLRDLIDFCSRCRDELVTAADYRSYIDRVHRGELPLPRAGKSSEALSHSEVLARCDELARVYETVEHLLASRNYGTFGDMILRAVALLRGNAGVLERERATAKFILIDEFQDSNTAQIELAALLGGEEQSVFAVGDPD